jgi:RNA polymerase sigma-70 factor (ECF subfamily)
MTGRLLELRGDRVGRVPDFEHVYENHCDYVWKSLRRLGVPDADLEDLTQDVFLKVSHALQGYDARRPMRPWLFGFCFRVASDFRKHVHLTREQTWGALDHPDGRDGPEDHAMLGERRALALRALEQVELERRAVLVMHDFNGHVMPEIADTLGVPLNTLYSRLRLARAEFEAAVLAMTRGGRRP